MNFDLTEERQMLQDTLRRYLREKYDTETRNKILDSDTGMSAEIWAELAELGVIGALFTEDQGGFGRFRHRCCVRRAGPRRCC